MRSAWHKSWQQQTLVPIWWNTAPVLPVITKRKTHATPIPNAHQRICLLNCMTGSHWVLVWTEVRARVRVQLKA